MKSNKFWECDQIRLRRMRSNLKRPKIKFKWYIPPHVKVKISEVPDGYLIDGLPYRLHKVKIRFKIFWQVECPCCGKQVRSLWKPAKQIEWRCADCWRINLRTRDIFPPCLMGSIPILMRKDAATLLNSEKSIHSLFHMGLLEVT
jgi:hypothetical protein